MSGTLAGSAALPVSANTGETAKTNRAHFVLVHGAWHASWCWIKLVPLLRAQGHMVTTVDLPGRWYRPHQMTGLNADGNIEAVGQVLRTSPVPAIVVGHSMGGATISLAAERYPDLIRRLVYLTAFLVPPGGTVGQLAASDKETLLLPGVKRIDAKNGATIDPAKAKEIFFHDCSDDDVRTALQLLGTETPVIYPLPIQTTPSRFGRVPRAYVECLQDKAIGLTLQRSMVAALPCERVVSMDTSHSPFFSKPEELARILVELSS
jgi:pimeloyl-ACP methyl ester carboxylesterase